MPQYGAQIEHGYRLIRPENPQVTSEDDMRDEDLKEILTEFLDLVAALEEEVRSLQVLTTHRVAHSVTDRLDIPTKANALHVQVQSLRGKIATLRQR